MTRPATARRAGGARQLAGDTAWATLGRLAAAIGGFVSVGVAARLLTAEEFGAFLLALSIATFGGGIARLGLDRATVRLVADRIEAGDAAGESGVLRTALLLAGVASAVTGGLLAGPPGTWLAASVLRSDQLASVMPAVGVWAAAEAMRRVMSESFRGMDDIPRATALGDGMRAVLLTVGFLGLLAVEPDASLGQVTAAAALTCVLIAIAAAVVLAPRLAHLPSPSRAPTTSPRAVLRVSLPMLGAGFGVMIVGQGDLWVVGRFLGEDAVATYGAALRVGALLFVPMMVINAVVPPIVVRLHARDELGALESLLRAYTALATAPVIVATAVLALGAEPILEALFGPFAGDGAGVLVVLALSQVVAVATGSCGITLLMTGHERVVVVATLTASGILLASTTAVAAAGGGILAVSIASGASTVVLNVGLVLYARSALGIWTHATASPRKIAALRHVSTGR